MLLCKAEVKPSSVQGLGLFATELIPKGTKIWQFSPGLDLEVEPVDFAQLHQKEQQYITSYGFLSKKTGKYHLSFDNVKFINHAQEANVASDQSSNEVEYPLVATTDIQLGEEVLQDYGDFEADHRFTL
jgi:uncharacterized protein